MKGFRRWQPPPKRVRRIKSVELERGRVTDIALYKRRTQDLLKYHWEYYSELAYQRSEIIDRLRLALANNTTRGYSFEQWQRAVKYKFALDPLSLRGSLGDPGGRFNIGDIDRLRFAPFPALYLACDKDTALQELLGQGHYDSVEGFSPLEMALTKSESISVVETRGELDQIFDLNDAAKLNEFVDLIKGFKLSKSLREKAEALHIPHYRIVSTVGELSQSVLAPNWQEWPMLFDIPSNSQIFGQIMMSAGVQGILYPSKMTKKPCLAIYPETFKNSSSYVELQGDLPNPGVAKRMDSQTWEQFAGLRVIR